MPVPRTLARLALTLTLALPLGLPALASAQSLQSLYEAARAYDATYLAARALADSAQYRTEQALALKRPSASLSATAGRNQFALPQGLGGGGRNSVGVTLNGSLPLFNRASDAGIAQARKNQEAAQDDLRSAGQDLIVRVAQAYFNLLAAQDALATTRSSQAAITEQLASAKRNFEVGTATITDTREAQARYDLAVAQVLAAENTVRTSQVALDQLVGRTGVQPRPLRQPVVLPATQPADVQAWVMLADSEHPAIRKAQAALDVALLETDKARAGHLPTLSLVGSTGATQNSGLQSFGTVSGMTRQTSIGVQLDLPLYSGGAVDNRVRETVALQEKARDDLQAARRGVEQGTQLAFYNLQSGLAQVKALEAAQSSSQLALEATQLGYKVGVRVNVDVLNAQAQLYTTERDLAKARYDVLMGGLKLRQAAGALDDGDLQAVNRLLAP
ncbi:MAG: TolC family outer membrane protein [Burkholderiales bacterium]|nr:TolC family outer membrane protein [Burkholderiales bacterium]